MLVYYKKNLRIIMKRNFFDYVSSRNFFHLDKNRLSYPITFFFKNFNPTKYNYKIYDKEMLAIIQFSNNENQS